MNVSITISDRTGVAVQAPQAITTVSAVAPMQTVYVTGIVGGSGGGGGVEFTYTNAEAMPEAVGGWDAGSTFDDKTLQQMFDGLLYPYQVPLVTVNDNFSTQYQVGDDVASVSVTLSAINSSNIQSGSLSLILNENGSQTTIATGLNLSDFPYTYSPPAGLTAAGNQYIRFKVTGTDTRGGSISHEGPSTYWRWRVYWGNSSSATLTAVSTLSGSVLDDNLQGTRAFASGTSVYKYLAWPDAMGSPAASPNGFKFDNNTNVPMATSADDPAFSNVSNGYYYQSVTETINGESITYRVYRSKQQLNGALNINVF